MHSSEDDGNGIGGGAAATSNDAAVEPGVSTGTERARRTMRAEVLGGLARPQKELSPKYFYDHRGSELFERITELPEYYPTRTEEALLETEVVDWVEELEPRTLVELGAGSARKTRVLLDAMLATGSGHVFVPVDVSGDFLRTTVAQVRREYPGLGVEPVVADISRSFDWHDPVPAPVLFVLLGSTIGNFAGAAAVRLLSGVADILGPDDRLLLGADLRPGSRKTVAEIEAAYNDSRGVTAAFNLNVLRVLNRTLGSDFRLDRFRHRAFYDADQERIEMHLESLEDQVVSFPDGVEVVFERGETIRTEISGKYDRASVSSLLETSGLELERWTQDANGRFSLSLAREAGTA